MAQKPRENKATEGREKVPERWSAQQKTEVVLRLLRGEDLVEVSPRGTGLTAGAGGMAAGVPGDRSAGTETPGPRPMENGS